MITPVVVIDWDSENAAPKLHIEVATASSPHLQFVTIPGDRIRISGCWLSIQDHHRRHELERSAGGEGRLESDDHTTADAGSAEACEAHQASADHSEARRRGTTDALASVEADREPSLLGVHSTKFMAAMKHAQSNCRFLLYGFQFLAGAFFFGSCNIR